MRRLGLVLVCTLAACDKGSQVHSEGSASPRPPAPIPAPPVPVVIADASVAPPTLSAAGGLSTLGRLDLSAPDTDDIARRIGLPGVTVSFEVMAIPAGPEYREEGYWAVKRGDKEIVQLFRMHPADDSMPAAVIVWSDDVATSDGTKVGDTVATLVAKHPDLTCDTAKIANIVNTDIVCRSPKERQLGYIIDARATTLHGKVKPAKIAKLTILAIAHEP